MTIEPLAPLIKERMDDSALLAPENQEVLHGARTTEIVDLFVLELQILYAFVFNLAQRVDALTETNASRRASGQEP